MGNVVARENVIHDSAAMKAALLSVYNKTLERLAAAKLQFDNNEISYAEALAAKDAWRKACINYARVLNTVDGQAAEDAFWNTLGNWEDYWLDPLAV